jgi:hypothetical protein
LTSRLDVPGNEEQAAGLLDAYLALGEAGR